MENEDINNRAKAKLGIINNDTQEYIGDYKPKDRKPAYKYCLLFCGNLSDDNAVLNYVHFFILEKMDYSNRFVYNKDVKKIYAKELKISMNTLNVNIYRICKTPFMKKLGNGLYFVNPDYAAKANLNKISEIRDEYNKL